MISQGHGFEPAVGGVSRHVSEVARGLAAIGHQVLVATGPAPGENIDRLAIESHEKNLLVWRMPELAQQREGDKTPVSLVQSRMGPDQMMLSALLNRLCRQFEPQVIHGHDIHRRSRMLTPALFHMRTKVPIINTIHTGRDVSEWRGHTALPFDHTFTVSEHIRSQLPFANRASFLPPGVDPDFFRPSILAKDLHPSVVVLGPTMFVPISQVSERKGADLAVEAFVIAAAQWPELNLLMVDAENGSAEPPMSDTFGRQLRARIRSAGLAHRAHFDVFSPHEMGDVHRAVAFNGGVLVHPSRTEGLSTTPLESMSCGLPTIVTDIPGHRTVTHGDSGLVVPLDDPQKLAGAVLLARQPHVRRHLIEGGNLAAKQYNLFDNVIPTVADVYSQLAGTTGRRIPYAGPEFRPSLVVA